MSEDKTKKKKKRGDSQIGNAYRDAPEAAENAL